jgi:sulfur carrier protein
VTKPVRINGKDEAVRAATVAELLRERGVPESGRGVAVAVNRAVVPRTEWVVTPIAAGDRVEIIRPIVGG